MLICDYGYYKNAYYGNLIAEEDFARLSKRASDKINAFTFWRISDIGLLDLSVQEKVKDACCALAEKIHDIELSNKAVREVGGAGVSSVSSGSESISFGNASSVMNEVEVDKIYYSIVKEYLTGTGLLFAGI